MRHPTPGRLSAYLDGETAGVERDRVERHLAGCPSCRATLASLGEQDHHLRPLLEHEPGEAYFEGFAARVEDRIRAAGLRGAQARLGGGGALQWLRSPRGLAWVGATAAVIVGAGIVMLAVRDAGRPPLDPELRGRLDQQVGPEGRAREAVGPPQASERPAEPRSARVPALPGAPPAGPAEDEPRPPASRQAVVREPPAGGEPSRAPGRADRSELREGGAPEPPLGARSPAAVSPQRSIGSRRTASGEDVPLRLEDLPVAAPQGAGSPPATGERERDLKAAKPRWAQPMTESGRTDLAPGRRSGATIEDEVEVRLCGSVVDPEGRPVAGAVVALADRGRSTNADATGRFCLTAPVGARELTVMAVGYAESRLQIRPGEPAIPTVVTLQPVSVLGPGLRALAKRAQTDSLAEEMGATLSGLPDSILAIARLAGRLAARGETRGSADDLDAAAAEWERVVASVPAGAARTEARYRIARARHRAWQLAPTPERSRSARLAVTAFLADEPRGPRRDQAQEWREGLRGRR